MLIPLTTDAVNERFPWITAGLIATNVAVFLTTGMGSAPSLVEWGLAFGNGLHPQQWLTCIFMHVGFTHLIGNMLFLWVFGAIVEGKLGWWRFLLVYLATGIASCALMQMMTFWFGEGLAIGASGAIYALIGMALIWAPETEIEFQWVVGRFGFVHWSELQISVLWVAILYVGFDAAAAWRIGFRPNAAAAHTLGALLGIAFGLAALRLGMVECQGQSLLAVMTGSYMRSSAARRRRAGSGEVALDASHGDAASSASAADFVNQFETSTSQPTSVPGISPLSDYEQAVRASAGGQLTGPELLQHADRMCRTGLANEAVPLLEEYLRRFQPRADVVRLKLAEIVIRTQQRPQYGLRLLEELPAEPLKPQYEKLRRTLTRQANAMIDAGVLELEGRAW